MLYAKCLEGKSYKSSPVPDLPEECINEPSPFNSVGIDLAGPLYVHDKEGQESKAYICLWTCASTHALHLEVNGELSAIAFLLVFLDISVVGEVYQQSFSLTMPKPLNIAPKRLRE